MTRLVLSGCVLLLLACGVRPVAQPDEIGNEAGSEDSSSTASEDTLAGTDTLADDPDFPDCYPIVCSNHCERYSDECGDPMLGSCSDDGICECSRTPSCLPCAEQECGPYEQCGYGTFEYGECLLKCWHEFEYSWDPELGCTIVLPRDIPSLVLNSFFLDIAGSPVPFSDADACVEPEYAEFWVFDQQALTITLCSEACMQFESVGELVTGWGFPCE